MNQILYQKNLGYLAGQNARAAAIVDAAQISDRIQVQQADGRPPSAVILQTDQSAISLHSKYDPEKEAKVLVDGAKLSPTSNLVLMGFGLGYHLLELLRRPCDRSFVLIAEANPAIVKTAFHLIDYEEIFSKTKLYWLLGEHPEKIQSFLKDDVMDLLANGLEVLSHGPSEKIGKPYYDLVKKCLADFYVYAKVNVNTQVEKASRFVGNAFENLEEYVRARPVKELFGIAGGKPVFVAAAGPSLDKTVDLLREVRGRGIILAVDSALKTLLMHQVVPDYVISIDFTAHAHKYFHGLETEKLSLVFDIEIYPGILQNFKGRKYAIHLPRKSVSEYVNEIIGDRGSLNKGLSVSHSAVLLAEKMEAGQIVFVGQDLAYPKAQWHTKGSAYFQTLESCAERDLSLCETEDIFGGKITSSTALMVFKNHFEVMLQEFTIPCYDATEGGARIKGTQLISLQEAIVRFCDGVENDTFKKEHDYGDEDLSVFSGEEDLEKVFNALKKMHSRLEIFNHRAAQTAMILTKAQEIFWQTKERGFLIGVFQKIREVTKYFDTEQEILDLLRDNATEAMILRQKRTGLKNLNINTSSDEEVYTRIRKEVMFFNVLVRASDFVAREAAKFLNRVIEKQDFALKT